MADKIKLDIISDVVCPWCIIGYKRLEKAISEMGIQDKADEALARLDDSAVRKRVQDQEEYWRNLGVLSVPTVVFNHASALTGAQPVDVYKEVLAELIEH